MTTTTNSNLSQEIKSTVYFPVFYSAGFSVFASVDFFLHALVSSIMDTSDHSRMVYNDLQDTTP